MTKQTIIPAGYRFTVESWEKDADNYKTEVMEGLQESSVKFLADFVKLFYSKNNYRGPKGFGNMREPSEIESTKFSEASQKVIDKHINPETTQSEILQYFWDSDEKCMYGDHHDGVMELAYELGLSGGDFYTRVLDSFKVEYVPVEIVLKDVTEDYV